MAQTKVQRNDICESVMIAIENKEIELDYRPQCHGLWLDVHLKIEEVMK